MKEFGAWILSKISIYLLEISWLLSDDSVWANWFTFTLDANKASGDLDYIVRLFRATLDVFTVLFPGLTTAEKLRA